MYAKFWRLKLFLRNLDSREHWLLKKWLLDLDENDMNESELVSESNAHEMKKNTSGLWSASGLP